MRRSFGHIKVSRVHMNLRIVLHKAMVKPIQNTLGKLTIHTSGSQFILVPHLKADLIKRFLLISAADFLAIVPNTSVFTFCLGNLQGI